MINIKKTLLLLTSLGLFSLLGFVKIAFCSTATDTTSTIMDWLPLIIQFAMLGMILGLLKKFGKI